MKTVHDYSFLFAGLKDFPSEDAQIVWTRLVTATMGPCDCKTPCRLRLLLVPEATEKQPVPSEVIQRVVSEWAVTMPEELEETMLERVVETLAAYLPAADARLVIDNYYSTRQILARHRLLLGQPPLET